MRLFSASGSRRRDARGHAVVRGRPALPASRSSTYTSERLLPSQPDLDVAGRKLVGDLERHLREEVEQPEARRRLERLAQPLGGPGDVLVAERARCVEV